jgi:hypothetical protein
MHGIPRAIRSRKSKKDRQHNGEKEMNKRRSTIRRLIYIERGYKTAKPQCNWVKF